MTPEQHRLHIQDIERMLYKAEHGMGMPYSAEDVAHYRHQLEAAREQARLEMILSEFES